MKRLLIACNFLIITFVFTVAAHAATLYTPTITTLINDFFVCTATNVSGSQISLTVDLIDSINGTVVATTTQDVDPRKDAVVFYQSNNERYYCRFKIDKASTIRASGQQFHNGLPYFLIPAN
jgi:hypothetical protein